MFCLQPHEEGGTRNEGSTVVLKLEYNNISLVFTGKAIITGIKRIHLRLQSASGIFDMSTHYEKVFIERYWVIFWVLWVTGSVRNNPQGMGVTLKQVYPLPARGGWTTATVLVFIQVTVWAPRQPHTALSLSPVPRGSSEHGGRILPI